MHETTQKITYSIFWKRFAAALIDGIILNTAFEAMLTIFTNVIDNINLASFDTGTCELILSLVYFAALDSLPKQVSVGKKLVETIFNDLKDTKLLFIKETKEYFTRLISNSNVLF